MRGRRTKKKKKKNFLRASILQFPFSKRKMASPTTVTIQPLHAPVVSSRAVPLVVVSTVFQTLAVSTIILRFLSKHSNRGVGVDDWVSSRGNQLYMLLLPAHWTKTVLLIAGLCSLPCLHWSFRSDYTLQVS